MLPMLDRVVVSSRLADETVKYVVRLTTPPCEKDSPESVHYRFSLVQAVVENPFLIDCGPNRFETLRVFFNGNCWILEAEAVGK